MMTQDEPEVVSDEGENDDDDEDISKDKLIAAPKKKQPYPFWLGGASISV